MSLDVLGLDVLGLDPAMLGAVGGASLAGLIGSPHCIGMCGGFAVASAQSPGGNIAWTLGRLSTYALMGALAGTVGNIIPGPTWLSTAVAALFLFWFALRLAGLAPELPVGFKASGVVRVASRLVGRTDLPSRYAFGVANGFLPCGLVYAALAFPVAVAHPGWGAVSMVAFGLGTVPALSFAALGLRKVVSGSLTRRRVLAAGVLVLGLGSLSMRVHLEPPPDPTIEVSCH